MRSMPAHFALQSFGHSIAATFTAWHMDSEHSLHVAWDHLQWRANSNKTTSALHEQHPQYAQQRQPNSARSSLRVCQPHAYQVSSDSKHLKHTGDLNGMIAYIAMSFHKPQW